VVLSRGVARVVSKRGFAVGKVSRLYREGFEYDTSSSNADRLRLLKESSRFGSTFSESEISGEGARRFREGAELGVMASTSQCEILEALCYRLSIPF